MKNSKRISKDRKDAAKKILKFSRLEDRLSQIGKVSLIGSYKYDLMYEPDIDVIVETKDPRASALKALNLFFDNKYFRKLELGDFENFPMPDRPKSYILVLETIENGVKWEIEIWFHKNYPSNVKEIDLLLKNMSDEQRDTILKIKHQRALKGKTKSDLSSTHIYKGVLLDGKKGLNEF